MNGRNKDIDPATELVEEDEEQALPESDDASLDLDHPGPASAGRAALVRAAKLAPSSPGVYRMLDVGGEVLYVGKAKNIRKRIVAYTRPTGHDTRIERVIATTATVEFVSTATDAGYPVSAEAVAEFAKENATMDNASAIRAMTALIDASIGGTPTPPADSAAPGAPAAPRGRRRARSRSLLARSPRASRGPARRTCPASGRTAPIGRRDP